LASFVLAREPRLRVDGLALFSNLEIQVRAFETAGVADLPKLLAFFDFVASLDLSSEW